MEKKNLWVRLTEEYSSDGFEAKMFPWCIGAVVVLAVAYLIAIVINPWNAIVIPLVLFAIVFVGFFLLLLAYGGAEYLRKFVEFAADQDFEGDK